MKNAFKLFFIAFSFVWALCGCRATANASQNFTFFTQPQLVDGAGCGALFGTRCTVSLGYSPTVGDLILCAVSQDSGNDVASFPAGFTSLPALVVPGELGQQVGYRVVTAGDSGSYILNVATATPDLAGACLDYNAVDTTRPIADSSGITTIAAPVSTSATIGPVLNPAVGTRPVSFYTVSPAVSSTTQSPAIGDYDFVAGNLEVHGQHQPTVLNLNTAINDSLVYASIPANSVVAQTILLRPKSGPFTVSSLDAPSIAYAAPTNTPAPTATPVPTATPAPTATPPPNYVPTAVYVGPSSACGGGYDPGHAVLNAVATVVQGCGSDVSTNGDCGQFDNCAPRMYIDTHIIYCDASLYTHWNTAAYAGGDAWYQHTTTGPGIANRLTRTGGSGKCDATGGATSTLAYFPNPLNTANQTWWINNYMAGSTYVTPNPGGRTWVRMILDDAGIGRFSYTTNNSPNAPYEFSTLDSWRNAIGTELLAYAPYQFDINCCGSGGGNQSGNNTTNITGEGIVNWAFEMKNLCDSDTSGNIKTLIGEKNIGFISGSNFMYTPANMLAELNGWSQAANDTNCAGVKSSNLDFSYDGRGPATGDSITLRWLSEVEYFFSVPTDGSQRYVKWQYCDNNASALNCLGVFPENQITFTAPVQSLDSWVAGNSANGNGCPTTGTATGGMRKFVVTCDGSNNPVYVREGTCYRYGTLLGNCAIIWNLQTSAVTLQSSWFSRGLSAYTHELTVTGAGPESYVGDNPSNGTVCPPANGCGGSLNLSTALNTSLGAAERQPSSLVTNSVKIIFQ